MINFNKPELYQTRSGVEFEIYNADRRHGCVDGCFGYWTNDGCFIVAGNFIINYDLILKKPEPIVRYINLFEEGDYDIDKIDWYLQMIPGVKKSLTMSIKMTIIGEEITTEIIHRKGE